MSSGAGSRSKLSGVAEVPSRSSAGTATRAEHRIAQGSQFQSTVGSQAMQELLAFGVIQAKLRISQPGDPDEAEADRAANEVVTATHAPKIQRKCACSGSGSPCATCQEDEQTIHRSAVSPALSSSQLSIQRAPAGDSAAHGPETAGNPPKPSPTPHHAHPLVVDDDAKAVGPHQMRKSAFIALLRADACATADAVLMSVGRSTKACPYIEKWLAFYEKQSADHIARAIVKYAPETAAARSAHEAIRLVTTRVQRATITWAKTGKISGLPEGLSDQVPQQGFLGAVHKFASSSVGGAILGFMGGSEPKKAEADSSMEKQAPASVSRKAAHGGPAPAHDAANVRSQLGGGHSLDSRVQSQMSSAFGHDFSGVRIHTDSRATALASSLNARAFTVGTDVAFASGEYKPGTPIGDALIAHELAHVVQQSSAARSSPMAKSADRSAGASEPAGPQLENDADLSAVGAIASIWSGAKSGLADLRQNAVPRLRSGLRLQRCESCASCNTSAYKDAGVEGPSQTQKDAGAEADAAVSAPPGGNMAKKPLIDGDKSSIRTAFKDAPAAGAVGTFKDGPRFVLHDTGKQSTGKGKTAAEKAADLERKELNKIAEHKASGGTPVGEGPSSYVTSKGTPVVAHPHFFEADRPTATEFERGNDLMDKLSREKQMQTIWNLANAAAQNKAIADYLGGFHLSATEIADETTKAKDNLDPAKSTPSNRPDKVAVFTTAAGAVALLCARVATAKGASGIAVAGKEKELETACGALTTLFATRKERVTGSTNLEIFAEEGSDCNTGSKTIPFPGYPPAAYEATAKLYLLAALEIGMFPEITTHYFLDKSPITKSQNRCDPRCWDLALLYTKIAATLGHPKATTYGVEAKLGTTWGTSTIWWHEPVCGPKP